MWGAARPREWDVVATTAAPGVVGDELRLAALPGGELRGVEKQPPGAVVPLAAAVERSVRPPYRAEAIRRDGDVWAVAARRVEVVEQAGLDGDEAELVVSHEARTLHVDGRPRLDPVPGFERAGAAEGEQYVLRARRLAGDLWEVEASPL
jgi:hypothetical protein